MHAYIHTYKYIHVNTYIHYITLHYLTLPYITLHYHTYIHTYIHACMHAYIHTYIRTYIHAYIYMHIYICIYICICIYIYIYHHLYPFVAKYWTIKLSKLEPFESYDTSLVHMKSIWLAQSTNVLRSVEKDGKGPCLVEEFPNFPISWHMDDVSRGKHKPT